MKKQKTKKTSNTWTLHWRWNDIVRRVNVQFKKL